MYNLVTLGDIKLDVFIDLGDDAKLQCGVKRDTCEIVMRYGEKIPVDSAVSMMAGSAANIAIGARRLGSAVSIISVVGQDTTATLAYDGLKKEGISTQYVTQNGGQSSFSAVLNVQGESTILAVHRPHTYTLPDNLQTHWLFLTEMGANYKNLYRDVIARAQKDGMKIGINPGAIQLEDLDDVLFALLEHTELLMVNKEEAQRLCQCDLEEAPSLLATLHELGPHTVIVTNGREGAYASDGKKSYHAPMFPGERVEATGAGDAFSTGVLAALIAQQPLALALAWGSANAASVVQYVGPQEGLLTRTQLSARLAEHPEYSVEPLT